ncbi:hypothetical protein JCM8547_005433 [Rhodosporidiobolus lusitaniae]
MLVPSALLALAASCAAASPLVVRPRASSAAPTVSIPAGTVEGVRLEAFNQDAFLGIPYAEPPVGDLRFRKPRAFSSFDGVYRAISYPPHCPGVGGDNIGFEQSEDCLQLNVIRPTGYEDASLPVGLWIHGGGFQMGGSADQRYNGSYVVQRSVEMGKPIVFVSINYRVAALGFLASAEVKDSGEQNFGLYDQRLAMQWVKENIGSFGGDDQKITVWGESAGARAISYHLLGYGKRETELFRAAIMESGSPPIFPVTNTTQYQPSFDAIVNGTGCADVADKIDCLRSLPLDAFNTTASAYKFEPVMDGGLLGESVYESLQKENFVRVPLLIGTNVDEGASFGTKNLNTTDDLFTALQTKYPFLDEQEIKPLLDTYYLDDPLVGCPYGTGDMILPSGLQDKRSNSIIGDIEQHARTRRFRQKAAKYSPVYSYHWAQPPENATVTGGAQHFVEVAYVFSVPNSVKTANTLGTRPGDAELAKLTTSQWVSFIHDLTPNNHGIEGVPKWPDYSSNASNFVHTRHGLSIEKDDFREEGIDYIMSLSR